MVFGSRTQAEIDRVEARSYWDRVGELAGFLTNEDAAVFATEAPTDVGETLLAEAGTCSTRFDLSHTARIAARYATWTVLRGWIWPKVVAEYVETDEQLEHHKGITDSAWHTDVVLRRRLEAHLRGEVAETEDLSLELFNTMVRARSHGVLGFAANPPAELAYHWQQALQLYDRAGADLSVLLELAGLPNHFTTREQRLQQLDPEIREALLEMSPPPPLPWQE